MSKYDPNSFNDEDLMSALKEEEKIITGNRDRHDVKVEKEGEIWHIRFLPVRFGPRKLFFSRVAQHWINKRPHFCAKVTPPESGGDENAQCDLCDVAAELAEHRVKDIATLGYKAGANPQWLTYCLVWSKKVPGQDMWEPQGDEVWTPYKFWLNKTLFEEVREYYVRQRDKKPTVIDSILNPDHGFDFYIKRSQNKLTLQKDDPRTIFPDGFNETDKMELMDHILGQIKATNYRALTTEEMEAARIKLEDAASKLEMGVPTSSRRSPGKQTSQDGDDTELPTRPAASRSNPRQAPASAPRRQVEAEAPASRPAPPARSSRSAPSAPPSRTVPSARPSAPVRDEQEDDIPFDTEGEGASESVPVEPTPTPSSRLRQASRQAPAPVPSRTEAPTRPSNTSSVDDDDDVTDEVSDTIPPEGGLADDEAPPAPVTKVQSTQATARPVSKMSERLRGAIQRTQQ